MLKLAVSNDRAFTESEALRVQTMSDGVSIALAQMQERLDAGDDEGAQRAFNLSKLLAEMVGRARR